MISILSPHNERGGVGFAEWIQNSYNPVDDSGLRDSPLLDGRGELLSIPAGVPKGDQESAAGIGQQGQAFAEAVFLGKEFGSSGFPETVHSARERSAGGI